MRINKKYIVVSVLAAAVLISIILFSKTKTARTIITIYYFTKSALASEKSRQSQQQTIQTFEKIKYPDGQTQTEAWLFKPKKSQSRSAAVLLPGVGLTKETLTLIDQTAGNLQKAGMTILVPFPENLNNDIITTRAIESYKNAFLFLENQNYIDHSKIGFIGFCLGSGFSLITAADPGISSRVSYVASFAAYADFGDYYAEIISGKTPGTNSRPWGTFPSVHQIAVENIIYRLSNSNDQQIIRNIFENGGSSTFQTNLTTEGKLAYQILTSKDPNFVKEQLPKLNQKAADALRNLSPINFVDQISAPVYMFHERNDHYEPVEESRNLKKALGNKAVYFETDLLDHTILRSHIPIFTWASQGPKMFDFLYQIFSKTS